MAPHQTRPDPSQPARAKAALRREVLAARDRLNHADLARTATELRDRALACPEVAAASTVACYLAMGSEPPTLPLLEALREAGVTVLLPVLLGDNDLDWAPYDGPGSLSPGRFGLHEPTTPRLGVEAIARAEVIVVPGLAVSETGQRLGRGGGSYDRALARCSPGAFVLMLLHTAEVGRAVPVEPHDRPVDAVLTPDGLRRF